MFNSDEPGFYPLGIRTSKCSSSCNNINDPCQCQELMKQDT